LSRRSNERRRLFDVATARALTLMVSQNYRCFPAARTAARLVQDAALGELIAVSIGFRRDFSSPPKPAFRLHTDPQAIAGRHVDPPFRPSPVDVRPGSGSRLLRDLERGRGGFAGPPTADAVINFGDVVVSYRPAGSALRPRRRGPANGTWSSTADTSTGQAAVTAGFLKDRVVVTPRDGKRQVMDLPAMSRIDRAGTLTEFAAAVREGREPETSGRDNLATLAFTFAAVDSSTRMQWVEPAAAGVNRANSLVSLGSTGQHEEATNDLDSQVRRLFGGRGRYRERARARTLDSDRLGGTVESVDAAPVAHDTHTALQR